MSDWSNLVDRLRAGGDGDGEKLSSWAHITVVALLTMVQRSGFPEPVIAPTISGGVTFQWGRPSRLVVMVMPSGNLKIVQGAGEGININIHVASVFDLKLAIDAIEKEIASLSKS